jgi:amphiphysin
MDKTARAIAAYQATGPNQLSLNVGDVVHVINENSGWSEAEITTHDGKKAKGWCPTNYLKMVSASSTPVDGIQLADAVFDYSQQREDELSFKAGDVIEIIDKTDQWWRGRVYPSKDEPRLFPSNYVQLRG